MARWTELKDFRDDCRSVQSSGNPLSTACQEALRQELPPPPYASLSYHRRLTKRHFPTVSSWIQEASSYVLHLSVKVLSMMDECKVATFLRIQAFTSYIFRYMLNSSSPGVSFGLLVILPWSLDGALFLMSTVHFLKLHTIFWLQDLLFTNILIVHNLILGPFWCNDCHDMWRSIITVLSDMICYSIIYRESQHDYQRPIYSTKDFSMVILGIEYELFLFVHGFLRSTATFNILFWTMAFLVLLFVYMRPKSHLVLYLISLLTIHVIEFLFIIYRHALRICWNWVSPWLLKGGIGLFWICYGLMLLCCSYLHTSLIFPERGVMGDHLSLYLNI
jgi:hypothetical protein